MAHKKTGKPITLAVLDEEFTAKIQAFSDKHCTGKVARLDLLLDMLALFNLRLTVKDEEGANGKS